MRSHEVRWIWWSEGIGFAAGLGAAWLGGSWHALNGIAKGAVATALVLGFSTLVFVRWRARRESAPILPTFDRPVETETRTLRREPVVKPPSDNLGGAPSTSTGSTGSPSEMLRSTEGDPESLSRNLDISESAPPDVVKALSFPELPIPFEPIDGPERERFGTQRTAEPSFAQVTAADLIEIWEDCRREGTDLMAALRQRYGADVHSGMEVGIESYTVAIEAGDQSHFFLLPEVGAAIRAMGDHFATAGANATRLARVQRVVEPALVRRGRDGFEIERKGIVE